MEMNIHQTEGITMGPIQEFETDEGRKFYTLKLFIRNKPITSVDKNTLDTISLFADTKEKLALKFENE